MILIKKTKGVEMYHDERDSGVWIKIMKSAKSEVNDHDRIVFVPMNKMHQVQRGIVTEIQKFYRKHAKK